jgi:hypothetical protein
VDWSAGLDAVRLRPRSAPRRLRGDAWQRASTDTIIPAGLGGGSDLDLAIWACFASARTSAAKASQDQHGHDLAA